MKKKTTYTSRGKVWLYPGKAGWHFFTIPKPISKKIHTTHGVNSRGWGMLPVTAVIGETSWDTSLFPDNASGVYLLPLKKLVRDKEEIEADDMVAVTLTLKV